ncbi:hypothetical protein DUI87_05774 [Hirundo rustica rustica]|uniref:Uncharacterized protein n=1 Tax=Hirundo rustica rustica TaxID=333673 RepID=A0A3M0LDJ0_HIRRU|nr:hypothetical protein DUI87_05774 [Hirundo rustica rustica]
MEKEAKSFSYRSPKYYALNFTGVVEDIELQSYLPVLIHPECAGFLYTKKLNNPRNIAKTWKLTIMTVKNVRLVVGNIFTQTNQYPLCQRTLRMVQQLPEAKGFTG